MQKSMFFAEEPPVRASPSLDLERALLTRAETSLSHILPLLNDTAPTGWYGKTSPVFYRRSRDYPERAAWWEEMEELATELTSGSAAHFSKSYTRRELRDHIENQGDWIFDEEAYFCQTDGGECI